LLNEKLKSRKQKGGKKRKKQKEKGIKNSARFRLFVTLYSSEMKID